MGQWQGNFSMFLNYIGLFYIWKIVIVSYIRFYKALQKFQYINIFCLFLTTQIGTKFWYVFKLYRSDLHSKISHRPETIIASFLHLMVLFFKVLVNHKSFKLFNCYYLYNSDHGTDRGDSQSYSRQKQFQ